ncbi:LptF/LptG family permease [soil metagenome]
MFGPKLARYVVRETFWLYLLGLAAFWLLLSIDTLVTYSNFLIYYGASLGQVGRLMLYKLPYILHIALPVALVFAVLLATGRLAKDSELKATYAAGVPPSKLLTPLILFGLGVSLVAVFNNGYLEPLGVEAEDALVNSFYYDRPPAELQTNVAYRVPDLGVFYAGRVQADEADPNRATLSGVLVIQNDGTTVTAPEGVWNSERGVQTWTLQDVQVTEPEGEPTLSAEVTVPFSSAVVGESLTASDQLTLSELGRRLSAARAAGGDTRDLTFTLHRRLADAFGAVIFALIAGALGLTLHGRSAGFGWTIVLIVVFYVLWTLSGNFFEQRVLPPVVAAWLTSAVVGVLGVAVAWRRLR